VARVGMRHAAGGDGLPLVLVLQIVAHALEQFLIARVGHQVLSAAEQLLLAVAGQVVGHQEATAGDGLEDAHVHIILHAAVEDDARPRELERHVVAVGLADERVRELLPQQVDQSLPPAVNEVADEAHIVHLLDLVPPVHTRRARQRQPLGALDAILDEPLGAIALGGEDVVEVLRLEPVPLIGHVSVDDPPRTRMQVVG